MELPSYTAELIGKTVQAYMQEPEHLRLFDEWLKEREHAKEKQSTKD